jgi:hypothetical protein
MQAAGIPAEWVFYDRDGGCDLSGVQSDDGDGMLIPITIGSRGNLFRAEAERAAATWRQATGRFPKASFMVSLLGYNEDPREVWEFRDARRYVRWWARAAGMDDLATADRWLGLTSAIGQTMPTPWAIAGMGFLVACGVFGEELRQAIQRNHKQLVPQ